MWKILLLSLISVFFIGCSDSTSSSDSTDVKSQTKYLTITKAPENMAVSIVQSISLEFSDELNISSITSDSAYILDESNETVGLVLGIYEAKKITFTPYKYLKPTHAYTLIITTELQNLAGQTLSEDYKFSFLTETIPDDIDSSPIILETMKPANSSIADTQTDISIQFSKELSPDAQYTGSKIIEVRDSADNLVEGSLEFFKSIITFHPDNDLLNDTNYTIELVGEITDLFGSVYDGEKSWNFSVGSESENIVPNSGFRSLVSKTLSSPASIIRTLAISESIPLLAVVSQSSVDFYPLTLVGGTYPIIGEKIYSFNAPSQINTMEVIDSSHLLVGTMSDGVYVLNTLETSVVESSHFAIDSAIFGVSIGKNIDGTIEKVYVVGPEYGLEILSMDATYALSSISKVEIAGTPLKIVEVLDYMGVKKLYVSDYDNGVRVFDENATELSTLEVNGSTKNISALSSEYGETYGVLATNTLGNAKSFDFEGNVTSSFDFPSIVQDITTLTDNYLSISKVYVSNSSNGVIVLNSNYQLIKESIIKSNGNIVSASLISNSPYHFLATLDFEGKINIFNAIADENSPTISLVIPADVSRILSTGTIQVDFSEYLDPENLNFTLYDNDTSQTVGLSISMEENGGVVSYTFVPDVALVYGHEYTLIMPSTIQDIVGNPLSDQNITYTVNTPPTALDDISGIATSEDVQLLIDTATLLVNDTDADGDSMSVVSVSGATSGSVTLSDSGVEYMPSLNYYGSSSFVYTIEDSYGESSSASVTLNVSSVNDFPVIDISSVSLSEDTSANIAISVSDVEDGSIVPVVSASNATVSLDGDFILYTPNADYFGVDTLSVSVTDTDGATTTQTINVTVTNVNDAPVVTDDNSTAVDAQVSVTNYTVPTFVTDGNESQVAALGGDGAYVVVWSGLDNIATKEYSIYTQKFDTNGYKDGGETKLEALGVTDGNDTTPQVSALGADGAYVVVWSGVDSDGDTSIFTQKFSAVGTFEGNIRQLEGRVFDGNDTTPQVEEIGNSGEYVVVWSGQYNSGDGYFYHIYTQKFDANGEKIGSDTNLSISSNYGTDNITPQITSLGNNGSYVVTWSGEEAASSDFSIGVQKFDDSTSSYGNLTVLEVDTNNALYDYAPQVTALGESESFVVAWSGQNNDSINNIHTQRFDANGDVNGTSTSLSASLCNEYYAPQLEALGVDGAYVITWFCTNPNEGTDIYTQRFNSDGSASESPTLLEAYTGVNGIYLSPQITNLGIGASYAVTWYGPENGTGDNSVFTQRFDASGVKDVDTTLLEPTNNIIGADTNPQITSLGSNGEYIVTWSGVNESGGNSIYNQKFNADGTKAIRYEGVGDFSISTAVSTPYYQAFYTTGDLDVNGTIYSSGSWITYAAWHASIPILGSATGADFDLKVNAITVITVDTYMNPIITIDANYLLVNDTDVDGDTLSVSAVSNSTGGIGVSLNTTTNIITIDTNGTLGIATFDYTVEDGNTSSIGVVEVNVIDSSQLI